MTSDSIQTVFIAGAGQMGRGIAQVSACSGLEVVLYDIDELPLQAAREQMQETLEKQQVRGRISQSAETILSRVTTTSQLAEAARADLVIEAVPEEESLKQELFRLLDEIVPAHVCFTSNTSAIRISNLAAATNRAERFCGLHFFNPVPAMSLVEVIRGEKTSEATLSRVTDFASRIGKQPIQVQGDRAGFIVNRILGAAMIEAIRVLESGVADATEIDKALRLGCGWKMGPLETADLAGLDIVMHMCAVMQQDNTDQVFAPPASLQDRVARGELGRKSGQGFYKYF